MAKQNILVRTKLKKAQTLLEENNLVEAARIYESVCRSNAGNAEIWARLSTIKHKLGLPGDAETCARQAVRLSPSLASANLALATALHAQNRQEEAIPLYYTTITLQPDIEEAHYHLANALRETGHLEGAEKAYSRLLEINPRHYEGLNNYGAMLTNMQQSEKAVEYLSRVLELDKQCIPALTNLGRAYIHIGNLDAATSLLHQAVTIKPDFVDANIELAKAYRQQGRYADALKYLDIALKLDPSCRTASISKAGVLEMTGDIDAAQSIIKPLIEDGQNSDAASVYFDLSQHTGEREQAVHLIENILNSDTGNRHSHPPLHFRLGKYYDKKNDYDTAFRHFLLANDLTNKSYNIDAARLEFDSIRQTYNQDFIRAMPRSSSTDDYLIFIVGMPRSGTSLVEQIFASHPDIHGAGETDRLRVTSELLSSRFSNNNYPGFIPQLSTLILDKTAAELKQKYSMSAGDKKYITDKMPHNFLYIGLILQIFPESHIIHCTRNPLDTCLSCFSSAFGTNYHDYTHDLKTLGIYYGLYQQLMTHWTSVFPGKIYEVSYSALIENQEDISKQMLAHCNIPWNEQCLDFHKSSRIVNTVSYNQVRQPIYKSSVDRWKNYDKYLESLRDTLDQFDIRY